MNRLWEMVQALLRSSAKQKPEAGEADAILSEGFVQLREVDAETSLQWLRLQRSMSEQQERRVNIRLVPRLAFGAAMCAVAAIAAYFYFFQPQQAVETFATGRGQQTRLVLQDSSEVTLNYTSRLVVSKIEQGKSRMLSLTGEAFFRVQRNETPFVVETNVGSVRVVGTAFNVRAREASLEVVVVHGVVDVTVSKDGKDSTLTLTQGQSAVCSQGGYPNRGRNVSSVEYPGWMYGKLLLNATTFEAACREIEMRFDVAVHIEDVSVRNEVITGTLEAKSADSAIAALCGLTGKRMRHDEQGYHIH